MLVVVVSVEGGGVGDLEEEEEIVVGVLEVEEEVD